MSTLVPVHDSSQSITPSPQVAQPASPPTPSADPVVAVCATHADADVAVRALGRAGVDMKKLSVIGKGYHTTDHAVGFYTMGDRIKTWGGIGGFWGAIWGLLLGPAIFYIPPVGLIAAAGPFVMALVGALEGAAVVGGVSAIGAALVSLGVTKDRAIKYEGEIEADRFVVIVHGTAQDIERARSVLASSPHAETPEGRLGYQ